MSLVSIIRLVTVSALILIIFTSCSSSTSLSNDSENGYIFTYRMDAGDNHYKLSSKMNQNLEVGGNEITTSIDKSIDYTMSKLKDEESGIELGVTIDNMSFKVSSPAGEMTPDVSPVLGKNFSMWLSPLGVEYDFSGIEEIKYINLQGGESGIYVDFQVMFPDFPDEKLIIGDKWPTVDTLSLNEGNTEMQMVFESMNKLTGIKSIEGIPCAIITAETTGKINITGEQQGQSFNIEGFAEGVDEFHFAYEKGMIIYTKSTVKTNGKITGESMNIPMTMNTIIENSLIK